MADHPLASGASTAIVASPVATAATGATPAGTPGSPLPAAGIEARFAVDYAGFRLDVDLRLPGRGVTALFGHSGSGKTTLLRCVAGLEPAARGRLVVNGECWQDDARGIQVPTHRRALGYVFQEASLFPHLSVRRNLEFGLRRIPAAARRVQLEHAVALLGIEALLERMPDRLSGGERQRVSIARALVNEPEFILADEPTGQLDRENSLRVLEYFTKITEEARTAMVVVTHDNMTAEHCTRKCVLTDGYLNG